MKVKRFFEDCGDFYKFEDIKVKKGTIQQFTQIAEIEFNQSINITTILNDSDDRYAVGGIRISPTDNIPYELWVL